MTDKRFQILIQASFLIDIILNSAILTAMGNSYKQVLVLVAGSSYFSYELENEIERHLPSDEELQTIITGEIASRLIEDNIQLNVKIIGRDPTGANLTLEDFNGIGQAIMQNYDDYDGVVVLSGQDTIPWVASYLAFSFENLGKPIIFTDSKKAKEYMSKIGGQQSLASAIHAAAYSNIPEVAVLSSSHQLIKGVDAVHLHANNSASFVSRNAVPLATTEGKIVLNPSNINQMPQGDVIYKPINTSIDTPISSLNSIAPSPMTALIDENTRGLILQTMGGMISIHKEDIRKSLQQMKDRHIPVVAISECRQGNVVFENTTIGQEIRDLNVIPGGCMTAPAATMKLRMLLDKQTPYDKMSEAMRTNMVGEMLSFSTELDIPSHGFKPKPAFN